MQTNESIQTVKIMDIPFLNIKKDIFLHKHLFPAVKKEEKRFIVTANPEIVMKTRDERAYKDTVQTADYVVPDGAGILLAAKLRKQPLQERISGYDLMLDLLAFADEQGLRCYFLGATEHVNDKMIAQVKVQYPNMKIAGFHHGFFDIEDESIVEDVRDASPDIIFVALGLPRQEQWIAKHFSQFEKGLFMGVGGSFDVIAGEVKRAPDIWIKLNLEWLYRIIKQPFRIKRIFKVFEFILRIIFKMDK